MESSSAHSLAEELRSGLQNLTLLVDDIATLLTGDSPQGQVRLDELDRGVVDLGRFKNRLEQATVALAARAAHATWDRRFGATHWQDRRDALAAALSADPDEGTLRWLHAVAQSLAVGAWSETERLCTHPFVLAQEAAWYPDRWLSAVASLRGRDSGAPLSGLVRDLLDWVSHLDHIEPEIRAELGMLFARALALTGELQAVQVLDQVGDLVQEIIDPTRLELGQRILAARSFVDRHIGPDVVGIPSSGWEVQLSNCSEVLDCAVELAIRVDQAALAAGVPRDALNRRAPALAKQLSVLAGVGDRLRVLLDDPPSSLLLEFVDRLLSDERTDDAAELLARFKSATPELDLRMRELAHAIAAKRERNGHDPNETISAAADAARVALSVGRAGDAVRWFREALIRRPDDAELQRELADALVYNSWSLQSADDVRSLREALELCKSAEQISPLVGQTYWAIRVQAGAEMILSRRVSPERPRHRWAAIAHSARYVSLNPAWHVSWTELGDRLGGPWSGFTALAVSKRAFELESEDVNTVTGYAIAAINVGDSELAESLLARKPPDDQESVVARAVHSALLGMAARAAGRFAEAVSHLEEAIQLAPDLLYRQWLAECLTLIGDEARADDAWRTVWREAPVSPTIADPLELAAAAWAALYQGQLKSALSLAKSLESAEGGEQGERTSVLVPCLVELARGETDDEAIRRAFGRLNILPRLAELVQLCSLILSRAVRVRRQSGKDDESISDLERSLAAIDRCAREREAEIRRVWSGDDLVGAELEWLSANAAGSTMSDEVAMSIKYIREALSPVGRDALPAPSRDSPASDEIPEPAAVVESGLVLMGTPTSWFAGFEGRELSHDLFTRASPDARAAMARRPSVDQNIRVRVRTDDQLEPSWVLIETPNSKTELVTLRREAAYAPSHWYRSVDDFRRSAASFDERLRLYVLPLASSVEQRLNSWSAGEVAFRLALLLNAELGLDDW